MDLGEAVAKGEEASRVLASPALADAKKRLEEAYVAGWKTAATPAEREAFHARMTVLEEVFIALRATEGAGKIAAKKVEQEQRREAQAAPRKSRDS